MSVRRELRMPMGKVGVVLYNWKLNQAYTSDIHAEDLPHYVSGMSEEDKMKLTPKKIVTAHSALLRAMMGYRNWKIEMCLAGSITHIDKGQDSGRKGHAKEIKVGGETFLLKFTSCSVNQKVYGYKDCMDIPSDKPYTVRDHLGGRHTVYIDKAKKDDMKAAMLGQVAGWRAGVVARKKAQKLREKKRSQQKEHSKHKEPPLKRERHRGHRAHHKEPVPARYDMPYHKGHDDEKYASE